MVRSLGITYRSLEESGIMLPVIHLECKFIKPAKYDDLLTVRTIIRQEPTARIHFDYEIYNEEGELINTGNTDLVFTDDKTRRPTRPPKVFMDTIKPYFE
jgi:acyl-CoA thioester hydrolase